MAGITHEIFAAVELWWRYVFHATWTSSLVAVVLLGIVRLGRRWPAQLRYGLLLIVLVKFAIPPMLELPTGLFTQLGPTVGWQMNSAEPIASNPSSDSVVYQGEQAAGISWSLAAKAGLMGIHLLGFAVIATSIVGQWCRITGATRKSHIITSGPLYARFLELSARLGVRRNVKLLSSSAKLSPMAFGVIRPTIIAPVSVIRNLPPDELDVVLAHELAHHRRGDLWTNWLLAILGAVWWFNPVLWIVNRRVREACENCCDDLLIVRGITTGKSYCKALLKIASTLPKTWQLNAAFGFAERLHPLAVRMGRIMDHRAKKLSRLPLAAMGLIVVLAVLILPGLPSYKPDRGSETQICAVEAPQAVSAIVAAEVSVSESPRPSLFEYSNEADPVVLMPVNYASFYNSFNFSKPPPCKLTPAGATTTLVSVPQVAPARRYQQFDRINSPARAPSAYSVLEMAISSHSSPSKTDTQIAPNWNPQVATRVNTISSRSQQPQPGQFVPAPVLGQSLLGFAEQPSYLEKKAPILSLLPEENPLPENFRIDPPKSFISPDDPPGTSPDDPRKIPPLLSPFPFIEFFTPQSEGEYVQNYNSSTGSTNGIVIIDHIDTLVPVIRIDHLDPLEPGISTIVYIGDTYNFQDPVSVPDPVGILPLTIGALLLTARRRRRL